MIGEHFPKVSPPSRQSLKSYIYSKSGGVILGCATIFVCTVTSTFCYTKIYLKLRHHQAQVQDHVHQGNENGGGIPLNISRYKRTLSSAFWVNMTLLVCYLPYVIVATLFAISRLRTQCFALAWELSLFLIMLDSSLNPLLLEDGRSKKSSEGYDATVLVFLKLSHRS